MIVASANVRKELKGARVTTAVHAALPADVIGWQEVETAAHVAAIAHLPGYATFWPGGRSKGTPKVNAKNATPISYKAADWQLEYGGATLAIPGVAKISPSRYTVWVVLKNKHTGRWSWFINVHTISGIAKHTNPIARWAGRARMGVWRLHMGQIRRRVATLKRNHPHAHYRVGMGDLNHSGKFGRAVVGMPTHYAPAPTHGGNWFDVIWTDNWLVGGRCSRRTNTPSDHDVLVANIKEN